MNNVVVVHVDSNCTAQTSGTQHDDSDNEPQPGPSHAISSSHTVKPVFTKVPLSESDSSDSVNLSAQDTRLPPPPPPIDVRALQAAIFEDVDDDVLVRPSSSNSPTEGVCYRKCTSYRLDPPLENPVDLAVGSDMVAVADYDNGVHFVDFRGRVRKHYVSSPHRICGIRLRTADHEQQVVMLAYLEQKWLVMIKRWPDMADLHMVDCPTEPQIMTWARRKIAIVEEELLLLGTCDSCSAIWTLSFNDFSWKTLIVERNAVKKTGVASIGNSFRLSRHTMEEQHSAYTDFDVRRWCENERRILLCQSEKFRLGVLRIDDTDKLMGSHAVKMKRKKNQQWIVKGPQLAVFDDKDDIIVYDASGKIFWFDGADYRIQKIIGDVGKSEVCALQVGNGWCYALCRTLRSVHAFFYRDDRRPH